MSTDITPIHPGEHLAEYLEEYDITQYRLAKSIHVPARRINEIVHGKRAITADTALRLGRYFGTSTQFWLNLQTHYDIEVIRCQTGHDIEASIEPLNQAAA